MNVTATSRNIASIEPIRCSILAEISCYMPFLFGSSVNCSVGLYMLSPIHPLLINADTRVKTVPDEQFLPP